jgi:coenzyme F420-reducing hydrogenase delta subunit
MMGRQLPAQLKIIEVPCAGSVSREFILEAFSRGADGVMVLTCHSGNCHSERGNRHAQARAAEIQALLPLVGIEKERLVTATFASTMGAEFARFVGDFADSVAELGSRAGSAVRRETV